MSHDARCTSHHTSRAVYLQQLRSAVQTLQKWKVESEVKQALGRRINDSGDLSLQLLVERHSPKDIGLQDSAG
jgi:hypothetical protein